MTRAPGTHLEDSTDSSLLACHHPDGPSVQVYTAHVLPLVVIIKATRGPVPIRDETQADGRTAASECFCRLS